MERRLHSLLYLLALIALGAAIEGCSSLHDQPGGTWVRIANRSTDDFERVTVTFPGGKREYGGLRQGASTDYQQVGKAYRYAAVEAVVKGESLTLQPQDFLGEKPLEPGRYTYALAVDGTTRRLHLDLVQDH